MEIIKYRIGICDGQEEDIARIKDALRRVLKKTGRQIQLFCQPFLNGEEMYAAACKKAFDLIFMDIELPGMSGFELAAKLCRDCPSTYLVFVSAQESFVFDALEYSPLWFVRKGNLEWDMTRALQKYLDITAVTRVSYRMKEGFGIRELPVKDIMYIEGSGHSLMIVQANGCQLRKYGSLKSMEEELEGCYFLRIHKNYLVNQQYIAEVGTREVHLTNGNVLEMGRDRKNEIREAMLRYEREKRRMQ